LESALRNLTARSAELRPPIPIAEFPPVSGPMNAILTVSFANTGATKAPTARAAKAIQRAPEDLMGMFISGARVSAGALRLAYSKRR
jgi:hypothetical protein